MDAQAQVESLFLAAIDLAPSERSGFLAQNCYDMEVRGELESWLEVHDQTGSFDSLFQDLTQSANSLPGLAPGQNVGVYRIVHEIGHGGMGEVYLAERAAGDFDQRVAIKLMRAGWDSPARRERFSYERQILARLEHPGIARLLDGGVTSDRVPYFAMEYVEGISIDDYCNRNDLDVTARLDLFLTVCEAVQYAHRNLVVHRDLKPSNILVTADGTPKLLDFGIAKLVDPVELSSKSTKTAAMFTPDYAAPEVIRGERVSTLSDVYSLGVVLYELLAGQRPHESGAHVVLGIMSEADTLEPDRPSTMAARMGLTRRQRQLRGDLDRIVLKALAVEPSRRYSSVEQFAEDIRRHRQGRPVVAQPDHLSYRIRKFVGRHRTAVAAAGVMSISLVAGGAGSLWQASVARQQRDQAEDARRQAESLTGLLVGLFEDSDPQRTRSDTVAAREILRRGLARVDELEGQPIVQADLLGVLGQVYEGLGEYDRAEEILRRALGLVEATLGASHPAVAQSLNRLGEVLRRKGEYEAAENLHLRALAIQQEVLGDNHPDVATTLQNLAFLMPYTARDDESTEYRRKALEVLQQNYDDDHELVIAAIVDLGVSFQRIGEYESAEAQLRRALELRRRTLGPEHHLVAYAMVFLADLLCCHLDGADEAEILYRDAIALYRRVLGPDALELGHPLTALAAMLEARGSLVEAERLVREALVLRESAFGRNHPQVAETWMQLARLLHLQGKYGEAESFLQAAHAAYTTTLGADHVATAGSWVELARTLAAQGGADEAETMVREALATVESVTASHPLKALGNHVLAQLLINRGELANAESLLLEALQVLERRRIRPDDRVALDIKRTLAELYDRLDQPDQAARYRAMVEGAN